MAGGGQLSAKCGFLAKDTMITLRKMEALCLLKKLSNGNKHISSCVPCSGNLWNQGF